MKGNLHLIEKLDHVFRSDTGEWFSGYCELTEQERVAAKKLFLHKTKSETSYWGGEIISILPAEEFKEKAEQHQTNPEGRWVIVVKPNQDCRGMIWEGAAHVMVYKSLV